MSSILPESQVDLESQEIKQFTPNNKISIIEGRNSQINSISRYNKYLNNSQSAIPSQHDLSGTFQSYHHADSSRLDEQNHQALEEQFNAYGSYNRGGQTMLD